MSNGCPFHGDVWCTCRPPLALQKPSAARAAMLARIQDHEARLTATLAAADALAEAVREHGGYGGRWDIVADALAAYDKARGGK